MEELIKIAEEQINNLEKMQCTNSIDITDIEISKEIINWCEFIYKLKEKTAQENKIQDKSTVIVELDEDFASEIKKQIDLGIQELRTLLKEKTAQEEQSKKFADILVEQLDNL